MERLRRDFSTITLVMIPVAIAINIAIGQLVYTLKLPLYLDSIGTIFVGAVAGPLAGLVTGALTNLIWGLSGINSFYTAFWITGAAIGLLAGLFSRPAAEWQTVVGRVTPCAPSSATPAWASCRRPSPRVFRPTHSTRPSRSSSSGASFALCRCASWIASRAPKTSANASAGRP